MQCAISNVGNFERKRLYQFSFLNQGNNSPETDTGRRFLNCRYCSDGTGSQSQPFCPFTFDQYTPCHRSLTKRHQAPGTPAPPCCCTGCRAIALIRDFGLGLYMTGFPLAPAAQALQLAQMGGRDDFGAVRAATGVAHHPPATGIFATRHGTRHARWWQKGGAPRHAPPAMCCFSPVPLIGWGLQLGSRLPIVFLGPWQLPTLCP